MSLFPSSFPSVFFLDFCVFFFFPRKYSFMPEAYPCALSMSFAIKLPAPVGSAISPSILSLFLISSWPSSYESFPIYSSYDAFHFFWHPPHYLSHLFLVPSVSHSSGELASLPLSCIPVTLELIFPQYSKTLFFKYNPNLVSCSERPHVIAPVTAIRRDCSAQESFTFSQIWAFSPFLMETQLMNLRWV